MTCTQACSRHSHPEQHRPRLHPTTARGACPSCPYLPQRQGLPPASSSSSCAEDLRLRCRRPRGLEAREEGPGLWTRMLREGATAYARRTASPRPWTGGSFRNWLKKAASSQGAEGNSSAPALQGAPVLKAPRACLLLRRAALATLALVTELSLGRGCRQGAAP